MIRTLVLRPPGPGLHDVTGEVAAVVAEAGRSEGLCTVFVAHTSASLLIQENADPRVRDDLERWLSRLVVEGDRLFTHDDEGPDDMPAHVRCALTATSLSIPIVGGALALGTWQAIYLWEHRRQPRPRRLVIHVGG